MAGLNIAKSIGRPELEKEIYFTLASVAESSGNMNHSLQYYKSYMSLNDSLFSLQKDKQVNELQIQYETDKKDLSINSLRQEKAITASQRKIYFLIAAVVLLVVVGVFIYLLFKSKRNRQLLEKEKEVDRLKSNFFANISHEFRTPLSLILGPLETMLEKDNNQENRFHMGIMKKSASRLLRLVNEILELSKAESGHLKINARDIEIEKYIKGVASSFQSLADEADIQLDIDVSNTNLKFYADENHIETICINLISNALKFSKAGGRIHIRLVEIAENPSIGQSQQLELQVIDNGAGISKEQVNNVFDRFYVADEQQFEGTGIGLALTKELVEAHGGTIHLTSELNKGTTVTVRLPFRENNQPDEQIIYDDHIVEEQGDHNEVVLGVAQTEALQDVEDKEESKIIILLIDDNKDIREYIKMVLPDKYTLLEAINGEEGVIQAKAFVPDLVISDVMMPKMNGYEVCKHLKNDEITSHIPVILLTAKASIDSRIEGLETEADLYMSKPFHPKELLLSIHNLIQSRKVLQERYNRQVSLNPTNIAIHSKDELFLQRVMEVLEQNYSDENFSVEQLSDEIGMSRSQLHRKLQALTNESTSQLIRTFRLQRAMELLKKQHASISEIGFMVGFSSYAYFNKSFVKHYNCTPTSILESSAKEVNAG
jgi:signal transduction histidine kinase/DNA-binding response OmpR family regulator